MVGVTQLRPCEIAGESTPGRRNAALWAAAEFLLIAVVCMAAYSASFRVGFLLDDFVHVDYATRAWQGDWQGFLHAFSGNWTGRTDNLTSYRPAISVSFLIDALLWQANAFGYHLTNVLMFVGCCVLVRMISLELSSRSGMKFGRAAALCAALLFAVHPLHPESVSWIIGRVDVQCGLFYLASVGAYLRFRRLGRPRWLVVSLLLFIVALPSKEMAVTLPAAVVLAEAILFFRQATVFGNETRVRAAFTAAPGGDKPRPYASKVPGAPDSLDGGESLPYAASLKHSLWAVLPFWMLLGAYAVLRTALIGTLVGGYGGSFLECWRNFLDQATVLKIFFPANEEIGMPAHFKSALTGLYVALAGVAGFRLWARLLDLRALLFLTAWMAVAILPAYQIWHIYPNLVGSRLFFLPSAPFCIILAFLAVPAAVRVSASATRWDLAISGAGILTAIAGLWIALLQLNIVPYVVAGRHMDNIRAQVSTIAAETPPGARTLFLDLPQDHQGAGMLGRPEFLEMLASRPFALRDLSDRVLTIESPVAGSREFLYPQSLRQILASPRLHAAYKWDADAGRFVAWRPEAGARRYGFAAGEPTADKIIWEPAEIRPALSTHWWAGSHAIARVVVFSDHLTIYPGSTGATFLLPNLEINPLAAPIVTLSGRCTASDTAYSAVNSAKLEKDKLRLVWTTTATAGGAGRTAVPFDQVKEGVLQLYAARFRAWSLGGRVNAVGLRCLPGDYRVDVYGLDVASSDGQMARMSLVRKSDEQSRPDPYSAWLFKSTPGEAAFAAFDVTRIPGAVAAKLRVTKPGKVFAQGAAPTQPSADELAEVTNSIGAAPSGRIRLPDAILNSPGLRQIRVVGLNSQGEPVGWPSDPQSIWIDRR